MAETNATPSPVPAKRWWQLRRAEAQARADATVKEIQAQFEATKHQFEAANEVIEARTGRNLIAAIVIGLALGLTVVFTLIFMKELFMIFTAIIVAFGSFELATALRIAGYRVPRTAIVLVAVATIPAAFYLSDQGKWLALLAGVAVVALWRIVEFAFPQWRNTGRTLGEDLAAGAFVQVYVPFLAGFAVLLASKPGGEWWTLAAVVIVVATDTGAYASGLTFGKHPMAPKISPKKTWEGFAGSVLCAVIAGILLAVLLLGQPWWVGVILGLTICGTATIGDLTESLIKRDIGVKDMSSWLPGHGGFLDRLDSILPSCAAAYILFVIFA